MTRTIKNAKRLIGRRFIRGMGQGKAATAAALSLLLVVLLFRERLKPRFESTHDSDV